MQKGNNANFKQIRRKVIRYDSNKNTENNPINAIGKALFVESKREQQYPLLVCRSNSNKKGFQSLNKENWIRSKAHNNSYQDSIKFSILLENNKSNNYNATQKKKQSQINIYGRSSHKQEAEKGKSEVQSLVDAEAISRKCRQIINKQLMAFKRSFGEMSSICKLKNKVMNPSKKIHESDKQKQENKNSFFGHKSILSQHNLTNSCKNISSRSFDISPSI